MNITNKAYPAASYGNLINAGYAWRDIQDKSHIPDILDDLNLLDIPDKTYVQYWPYYYGFLLWKNWKFEISQKTEEHIEKKFSVVFKETNEEENAKKRSLPCWKLWEEIGFEKYRKITVFYEKNVFYVFFEKSTGTKVCF